MAMAKAKAQVTKAQATKTKAVKAKAKAVKAKAMNTTTTLIQTECAPLKNLRRSLPGLMKRNTLTHASLTTHAQTGLGNQVHAKTSLGAIMQNKARAGNQKQRLPG